MIILQPKSDRRTLRSKYHKNIVVPFSSFSNNWSSYTGEPIVKCSDDPSVCPTQKNLADISQIGFWMEGVEGDFSFEIESISAGN